MYQGKLLFSYKKSQGPWEGNACPTQANTHLVLATVQSTVDYAFSAPLHHHSPLPSPHEYLWGKTVHTLTRWIWTEVSSDVRESKPSKIHHFCILLHLTLWGWPTLGQWPVKKIGYGITVSSFACITVKNRWVFFVDSYLST